MKKYIISFSIQFNGVDTSWICNPISRIRKRVRSEKFRIFFVISKFKYIKKFKNSFSIKESNFQVNDKILYSISYFL